MAAPVTTTPAWVLAGQAGPESLQFLSKLELPPLGDEDVLVKIHATSLNYRELALAKGNFNLTIKDNVVPGSDGAGTIEAVGSKVKDFQLGDRVCTHLTVHMPPDVPATFADINAGLGQAVDGTLRAYGVFHRASLVKMPANLTFPEAATLTCSALTAWNSLFGIESKAPKKGDIVLIQGTGGVSIAALQFALASGATTIATTSSDAKASKLSALGAHHVINYKTTPTWGEFAKTLTPSGRGVDLVVDVGGPSTVAQSLKAVRPAGVVALAGLLGTGKEFNVPSIMDSLMHLCITRGLLLGTRVQFEAMNRFIEAHDVKPALDERVFTLDEVKEAYEYMAEQKHFSKVAIVIDQ